MHIVNYGGMAWWLGLRKWLIVMGGGAHPSGAWTTGTWKGAWMYMM